MESSTEPIQRNFTIKFRLLSGTNFEKEHFISSIAVRWKKSNCKEIKLLCVARSVEKVLPANIAKVRPFYSVTEVAAKKAKIIVENANQTEVAF